MSDDEALPREITVPVTFTADAAMRLRTEWITADMPDGTEVTLTTGAGLGGSSLTFEWRDSAGGRHQFNAQASKVFRDFCAALGLDRQPAEVAP